MESQGGEPNKNADGSGFYYTRYPRDSERPATDQNFYRQLWHSKQGTPLAADRCELGRRLDRIAAIRVQQYSASRQMLVRAASDIGPGESIAREVDRLAFLFHSLGVEYRALGGK